MSDTHPDDPYVVFTPRFARFAAMELWSAFLGVCAMGVLLGAFQSLSRVWLWTAVATALLGTVVLSTVSRRSRRIVIGDTWITGPAAGGSESITIQFGTVDHDRSGVQGNRLRILSISGREITAKTAWYSPEDVEEMTRVLRDRCGSLSPLAGQI